MEPSDPRAEPTVLGDRPLGDRSLVGREIAGQIKLTSILGKGRAAVVYRAEHAALGRTVALKVLNARLGDDREKKTRFEQVMNLAVGIDHQHAVDLYGFGVEAEDGLAYVAMELLDGPSLATILARGAGGLPIKMPVERACKILVQVLAALAAAHARGVIHGDLTPSNLFLLAQRSDDGHGADFIKVTDFGMLKLLDGPAALLGAPEYVAPELVGGAVPDVRSDVYSAAVILFELLAGKPPFQDPDPSKVLALQRDGPVPPLEVAGLDARLRGVLDWALAKDPANRCPNAETLRRVLAGVAVESRPLLTPSLPPTVSAAAPIEIPAPTLSSPARAVSSPARAVSSPARARSGSSGGVTPASSVARGSGSGGARPAGPVARGHSGARVPLPRIPTVPGPNAPTGALNPWLMLGLVFMIAAGAWGGYRIAEKRTHVAELGELVAQKRLPAAEAALFERFRQLTEVPAVTPMIKDLLEQRRLADADGPSYKEEPIAPGVWRGVVKNPSGDQKFVLSIQRIHGPALDGTLEWPDQLLTTAVIGVHEGNQILFADTSVISGDASSYRLHDRRSVFIDGDKLHGNDGPYHHPIEATRD